MTRILLIEDTEELAAGVAEALEHSGYRVSVAATGESGLELAEEGFALVILDWMLPGIDGLTVLQRLRQHHTVPVLMLTARSDEVDRVMGLEFGADDYLTKPFSLRELIARVRALLRRCALVEAQVAADRENPAGSCIHGPLTLDGSTREASAAGQPMDLTRLEFDLLHLLMAHPGRVFARQYLLDMVWGDDVIITDRSVDNAVLKLRRKMGTYGDLIETVWGIGYRMKKDAS